MATSIGTMREFNPQVDSWILYQEQLEMFFDINGLKDDATNKRRVSALLSLIGPDTYRVLRDLCMPQLPKDKSFDQLCALLKTHFSPPTSVYKERIQFFESRQEEGESVNNWYARIHNLATNCEFAMHLGQCLKDKFICSMRSGSIRDRLCEEKPETTLSKLLDLALTREASTSRETCTNVSILRNPSRNYFKPKNNTDTFVQHKDDMDHSSGKWKKA